MADELELIRTSLRMTRVISDEIGMTVEDILQGIYSVFDSKAEEEDKINLSYSQWQYLITQMFHDEILIMALNKTILAACDQNINLNRNKVFLNYVAERIVSELKAEIKTTQHPIALLSLMNRAGGKKKRIAEVRTGVDLKW